MGSHKKPHPSHKKPLVRMSKLIKVGNRFAIKLTHTKTIQYQQREIVIWLPNFPDSDICPTRALTRMLKLRRTHWYHEITQTCPLFAQDRKGTPLTITTFRALFLEKSLTSVGVNTAQISPHSLRRGGTTFSANAAATEPVSNSKETGFQMPISYIWMSQIGSSKPQYRKWREP